MLTSLTGQSSFQTQPSDRCYIGGIGMAADRSIIIIGGGIAGLAGCYGQMNGYQTQIFELHDKPGGLCTAWQRRGYTFDGCIEWLVGSGTALGSTGSGANWACSRVARSSITMNFYA